MSDIEKIVSETEFTSIIVGGKTFKIGKIKTITYLKLAKFLACIFSKYTSKLKNFKEEDNEFSDILSLLDIIDKDELADLQSIILGVDKKFCENLDGEETIDLISALCEHNDFGLIAKKVQRVIEKLKFKKTVS